MVWQRVLQAIYFLFVFSKGQAANFLIITVIGIIIINANKPITHKTYDQLNYHTMLCNYKLCISKLTALPCITT